MTSIVSSGFDRLVDQAISEALGLLSDQQEREVIIKKFGLRDGIYQNDTEIAGALSLTPRADDAFGLIPVASPILRDLFSPIPGSTHPFLCLFLSSYMGVYLV